LELEKLLKMDDHEYIVYTYEKLLDRFEKHIYKEAHRYKNFLDMDDLAQVGRIALLKAFKKYDLSRDTIFVSVAVKYIKTDIWNYYRSMKEICECILIENEEYERIMDSTSQAEDIQQDVVDRIWAVETVEYIKRVVNNMKPKQKQVFELYYVKGHTMKEISNIMGVHLSYIGAMVKECRERIYSAMASIA
jgi:RNA polymerase sigma factor (sigma-70 family)